MQTALDRSDRWLRIAAPALIALGLCAFVAVLQRMAPSPMTPLAIGVIVLQVYVVSELCRWSFDWLDRRLGWRRGVVIRLAAQLALALVVAVGFALAIYVPLKLSLIAAGERDVLGLQHLLLIGLAAAGVASFLALIQFALHFFRYWQRSEQEAERRRQEALRAELDALRAQVDPHFLFNSLNTVYGLIAEDAERAQALLLTLAELFRHALRHAASERVSLHDELAFVEAYVELLRARHGDAVELAIDRVGDEAARWLPPLALQTLVENALKHNAFDAAAPLQVEIGRDGDDVVVSNERRRLSQPAIGAGSGLESIRRRYRLLGERPIEVVEQADRFSVRLPLLRGGPCVR